MSGDIDPTHDEQGFDRPPVDGAQAPSDGAGESDQMTPEQLDEAKRYGREELVCNLADRAIDLGYLAAVALVFARPLDGWLQQFAALSNFWLRLAALFGITIGVHLCVSLPLSLYSGHILEHKYGLSRQSLAAWFWRYTKRNTLAIAFGLAMVEGLYVLVWLVGAYWWLAAAAGFFAMTVVLGQLAPVLILPLFYKIKRLEDPQLAERFGRLSRGTGLSIEGVYRMEMSAETVKANAMLAGLGRTRRVILGDTLIDHFTHDEIEIIFAHEVGHHVHRHMRKMMLAGFVYSTLSFLLCDRVLVAWVRGIEGAVSYDTLPVYTLPLLMLCITAFSLVLEPLQNGISRHFERQSDRYALARSGRREAYRSAFFKLARLNKADPDPHPLEVFLFHSHPPISQRLALAEETA